MLPRTAQISKPDETELPLTDRMIYPEDSTAAMRIVIMKDGPFCGCAETALSNPVPRRGLNSRIV